MNRYDPTESSNFKAVKREIDAIVRLSSEREMYICRENACGGFPDLLISVEDKRDSEAIAAYTARLLYEEGLVRFTGLDKFLMYRMDGTLPNLRRIFSDIKNSAVYTNSFEGVIAFSIDALLQSTSELPLELFLEKLDEEACGAVVILFYSKELKQAEEYSLKKIEDARPGIVRVEIIEASSIIQSVSQIFQGQKPLSIEEKQTWEIGRQSLI